MKAPSPAPVVRVEKDSNTVYFEAATPRGVDRWSIHTNVIGVTTVSRLFDPHG